MIERILLADSGSGNTEAMMKVLLEIPLIQRASITVLHVVRPRISAKRMEEKLAEGEQILDKIVKTLNLDAAMTSTVLREGDPKDVVLQVANETNADLIVLGSRGLEGVRAILENSVSQYVFQLTSRSILLVKDDLLGIKPIKRVLIGMDQSASAQAGLKLGIDMLRDIPNGELWLVRTVSNIRKRLSRETEPDPSKDQILMAAAAEARRYGIKTTLAAPEGKAGLRICQLADDKRINLIILGSPERRPSVAKGLPDIDRLLGSSLSDFVRVNTPCPVLLSRVPD
ncbi:MAG: universal stress protein [Cyanobacteria bacterium P01_C01_bin.120]